MKLATFAWKSEPDFARVGLLMGDRMVDLSLAATARPALGLARVASLRELLEQGEPALAAVRRLSAACEADAGLLACVSRELAEIRWRPLIGDAHKFLCVGKNYRTHLEELKRTDLIRELPNEPTGFIKLNDCLAGHDTDVVRPASVTHLDYEPELVFVIGKPAYQVPAARAFEHVVGITLLNDLTCRDTQKREVASGSRFWTAKNAPGFGPLGPCLITMDEVPDPYDIWVTCSVNGEQRMRVNTSDQIWKLPQIIEHFSRLVPLMPGDMFSTGAPGGVAVGKPNAHELFLKPGDVVECAFEQPRMVLRNTIVAPPA